MMNYVEGTKKKRIMWACSVWQGVILFFLISPVLVVTRKGVSVSSFSIRPPLLERDEYETTYACEGRHLRISCTNEKHIRLVRANYGRFSVSICNDKGVVNWSVSCMSYWSFPIMKDRCSHKSSCSIYVSASTFGDDPCPGTVKYLEVQYHCVSPSSHSGPSATKEPDEILPVFTAPMVLPSNDTYVRAPQEDVKVIKNHTTNRVNNAAGIHAPSATFISIVSNVTQTSLIEKTPTASPIYTTNRITTRSTTSLVLPPYLKSNIFEDYGFENDLNEPSTAFISPIPLTPQNMCPPVFSRDINWNWTRAGETAVQKCPGGATGLARWKCNDETISWEPETPNLNECKSVWVDNLRERMQAGDSITSITSEIALMTFNKVLFSKDVSHVVNIVKQTLSRAVDSMEIFKDLWHRRQLLKELLESIVETVSNLLNDRQNLAWQDLTSSERRQVTSNLLQGLEEGAVLLSESLTQESSFLLTKANVLILVEAVDVRISQNLAFPLPTQIPDSNWFRVQDSLLLPVQSLIEYSKDGLARVVFRLYNKVDELLKPDAGFHSHTTQGQDVKNVTWVINSRVVAVSVGRRKTFRLLEPVQITFKHIQEENVTNPQCVFWDITLREWSTDGCWALSSNSSHTTCACNHVTNFALMMEVKPAEYSSAKQFTKQLVTSLGCALCVIFLLLSTVCLYILGGSQSDRTIIHKNLCLCLLVAELVFAAGVNQTHLQTLCGLIAGLLHYFFLVVSVWMFLDAFHLYVLLVEVYDLEKTRAIWYYVIAYGLPTVIVAVSAAIDPQSYGTNDYCWLRSDNYFIFSFVGPAVGTLFGSTVFLCIATCIMCHQTGIHTVVKGKEEAMLANIKLWIRWAIVMLCLVSLTWTAGLLYVNQGTEFLAYTFLALNCVLGLFVFVFYCLHNERVKEDLSKCFQQYKWLPKCLLPSKPNDQTASELPGRITLATNLPSSQQSVPSPLRIIQTQNCITSPKFTTQDHLSTLITINQEGDVLHTSVGSTRRKGHRITSPNVSRTSSPGHYGFVANQHQAGGCGSHQLFQVVPRNKQSASGSYSDSSGLYSVFADHIYESIEEDVVGHPNHQSSLTKQFSPPENYYGDHSDLSQHSSSSGYDQRPLLVTSVPESSHTATSNKTVYGISLPHDNYSLACTPELSRQPEVDNVHRSFLTNLECATIQSVCTINAASPKHSQQLNTDLSEKDIKVKHEDWEPVLPDLLSLPSDNVVMAVLEGEMVVSRLHADMDTSIDTRNSDLHKLSTYC
ncbi:latrophilin Cirl-like isoform X3 [Tachypleus tridentatus]